MLSKAKNRKFIAIFGVAHGGEFDEKRTGYLQDVDLKGVLRIALGANEVARIEISNTSNDGRAKPNYRLSAGKELTEIEPIVPEIPKNIRDVALKKFGLPSR